MMLKYLNHVFKLLKLIYKNLSELINVYSPLLFLIRFILELNINSLNIRSDIWRRSLIDAWRLT